MASSWEKMASNWDTIWDNPLRQIGRKTGKLGQSIEARREKENSKLGQNHKTGQVGTNIGKSGKNEDKLGHNQEQRGHYGRQCGSQWNPLLKI